ncbi:11780_t:CDS:2, partial [Gigaspora rosea]
KSSKLATDVVMNEPEPSSLQIPQDIEYVCDLTIAEDETNLLETFESDEIMVEIVISACRIVIVNAIINFICGFNFFVYEFFSFGCCLQNCCWSRCWSCQSLWLEFTIEVATAGAIAKPIISTLLDGSI